MEWSVNMDGSGAERNRELDTRHVPTSEHPPFPLLQLNPSAMSVVSQRVCSFPPPRVLNTSKSPESPFLCRTLRFTRKLLPVSQQTVQSERAGTLTNVFPLVSYLDFFLHCEARRCGQVAHDGWLPRLLLPLPKHLHLQRLLPTRS